MANLNKVMLIGRLTRDPEGIQVRGANGGAKFGFAVNNSKKNESTGQWEDVPVFIDCEMWNRGESKQGDRFLQTVRKGQQVYIEGHMKMDQWEDKNGGGKRSKLLVVVESFQYLEPRQDGGGGGGNMGDGSMRAPRQTAAPAPRAAAPAARSYAPSNNYDDSDMGAPPTKGGGGDEDIPF